MKIFEVTSKVYYHGSYNDLPIGTILTPTPDYDQKWGITDFYHVLEKYRPSHMLAHKDAVFMCDNPDDIDNAGGDTEWLFTVKPLGKIERHDMEWGTAISCGISDREPEDKIKFYAEQYWNGVASRNPVWEYLTPQAEILEVEEY